MANPFIQQQTVKNPPAQSLLLSSYQGGLNNVCADTTVGRVEATNICNMVFLKDGLIEKRKGSERYNDFLADKEIVFIDKFKPINEDEKMVYATLTDLYIDGKSVCKVSGKVSGVTINGRYFFVDGDKYRVYEKESGKTTYAVYEIIESTPEYDYVRENSKAETDTIYVSGEKKYEKDDMVYIGEEVKNDIGDPNPSTKPGIYKVTSADTVIPYIDHSHVDFVRHHRSGTTGSVSVRLSNQPLSDVTVVASTNTSHVSMTTDTLTFTQSNWDKYQTISYKCNTNQKIGFWVQYKASSEDARYHGRADFQITTFLHGDYTPAPSLDINIFQEADKTVTNTQDTKVLPREIKVEPKLMASYPAQTRIQNLGKKDKFSYVGAWQTDETRKVKWYEPCAHEIDDVYKGFNVFPKKPKYIAYRKDRLYISGCDADPHTLYISDLTNPYYFPATLGVQLPPNGDRVNGLIEFHDSMIISRSGDIYVLYGNSNRTDTGKMFELKRINTHTGVASSDSMQVVHNYLFYLGSDGIVYRMQTPKIDVDMLTTAVLSKQLDLFSDPINYDEEQLVTAKSAFSHDDYYLAIGDKMLVYNYRFMGWTLFTGLEAKAMYNNDNHMIWSNQNNHIMHFSANTYLDEGRMYPAFWESKLFDCSAPIHYKYFKYISLVLDSYEDFDSTARILFEIDYEDVSVEHTFKNAITRWGKAKFGDRFATRNLNKSLPIYVGRRGRLVKVKVKSGYHIDLEVANVSDLQQLSVLPNTVAYVTSTKQHFIYTVSYEVIESYWKEFNLEEINQPLKLYNVEIEYSLRGRR